jgi:hypothetical protein
MPPQWEPKSASVRFGGPGQGSKGGGYDQERDVSLVRSGMLGAGQALHIKRNPGLLVDNGAGVASAGAG